VDADNAFYGSTNGVLFDESQTTLIEFPGGMGGNYTIPASVTKIGDWAFALCFNLVGVTIPAGVTSIGADAFWNCYGLTNIAIPAGVTNIGEDAFSFCYGLAAITVDADNAFYGSTNGVLFDKSQSTLIQYPLGGAGGSYAIPGSVTHLGDDAFAGAFLTNIMIPATVTSIGDYVFWNCHSLTGIAIPASVTSISEGSFASCDNLTSVTIPNSVTNIGESAFQSCTSLASVTIPGSVTSFGVFAFESCASLDGVYFTGNAPGVDSTVFESDNNTTAYYLPGSAGWDDFSTNAGIPAVLWNPLIQTGDGGFGVQNNQFGFNITGTNNFTVVVEACTNLAGPVWIPLQTNTLANGFFSFSDPQWTNYPCRYYGLGFP
jgi:hypothetical protein